MRMRALAPGAALAAVVVAPCAYAATPPPPGTHVAALAAPSAVVAGERAVVSGRVAPAVATQVVLQRLDAVQGWVPLARLATGADGRFRASLPLRRSVNLRAAVTDAAGAVTASRRRFVSFRPRVALDVRPARFESIAGRAHVATGRVTPAEPGAPALLEARRTRGSWRTVARFRVRTGGRVRGVFTPAAGGDWTYRLRIPAVAGRRAGGEGRDTISTFGANPHHTPARASHYIVQEIDEFLLYYYEDGRLLRVLPVVFGAPATPTPSGRFRVYAKGPGPGPAFGPLVLWYHRGYGIHGTNQEYLLDRSWRYYSHGCTRNYNANIRWLWPRVPVGTPVVNVRG